MNNCQIYHFAEKTYAHAMTSEVVQPQQQENDVEFLHTERVGRRNALADIKDENAAVKSSQHSQPQESKHKGMYILKKF